MITEAKHTTGSGAYENNLQLKRIKEAQV
jgi:hypothetical protein